VIFVKIIFEKFWKENQTGYVKNYGGVILVSRRNDFIKSENNLKNIKSKNNFYCLTDNGDHPDHDVGEETNPDDGAEKGQHKPALVFL
jgi:hypothetical protein